MRRKGFTLIEVLIVLAIIGIVVAILGGGYALRKETAELKDRYISICEKDMRTANPYMDAFEILDRCEVQWEMGERLKPKSSTIIVMP